MDLQALIDRVADQPERFAVNVPQQISAATDGQWTSSGVLKTWTLSTQVPTAVSLSFHASRLALPASATLTVSGSQATVVYRASDINRGGLWGRPLVGDTLTFVLSVAAADVANVQFELDSLQAGYRGLGGLQSHPYFVHRMVAKAAGTATCVENYSCDATAANQGPAQAIVAILVGNQYQCTGTLLNDTRGDSTPYVLTARHCENGILGGGAPQAASSVAVYWDSVSPCGAALGSIYDGAPVQLGATTVVEQQDAWLIQLDAAPRAADAYWAGWDASGAVFSGGYSVHHALGNNKQFVGWYGQAIGAPYFSRRRSGSTESKRTQRIAIQDPLEGLGVSWTNFHRRQCVPRNVVPEGDFAVRRHGLRGNILHVLTQPAAETAADRSLSDGFQRKHIPPAEHGIEVTRAVHARSRVGQAIPPRGFV